MAYYECGGHSQDELDAKYTEGYNAGKAVKHSVTIKTTTNVDTRYDLASLTIYANGTQVGHADWYYKNTNPSSYSCTASV